MDLSHRLSRVSLLGLTLCIRLAAIGCASPGLPQPPSLNLPEPTRDLSATRIGNTVELRFTVPSRSTDKLPLHGLNLTARFCRTFERQKCQPISSPQIIVPLDAVTGRHSSFTWIDNLPDALARGNPQPLSYSVELLNISGRSAGQSAPALTAAGEAPAPIAGFSAEGSRLGILLRWDETVQRPGDVVLQRKNLAPELDSKKPEDVELISTPVSSGANPASLLDTTVKLDIPYRYTATRRLTVELYGRAIELLSSPSSAVDLTLKVYPPLSPTGLTAIAFTSTQGSFAIDLIWQPVDDNGLITPLAGYNIYRASSVEPSRLNTAPIKVPGFHDATAIPNSVYRYTVKAIDVKGNESAAAAVDIGP